MLFAKKFSLVSRFVSVVVISTWLTAGLPAWGQTPGIIPPPPTPADPNPCPTGPGAIPPPTAPASPAPANVPYVTMPSVPAPVPANWLAAFNVNPPQPNAVSPAPGVYPDGPTLVNGSYNYPSPDGTSYQVLTGTGGGASLTYWTPTSTTSTGQTVYSGKTIDPAYSIVCTNTETVNNDGTIASATQTTVWANQVVTIQSTPSAIPGIWAVATWSTPINQAGQATGAAVLLDNSPLAEDGSLVPPGLQLPSPMTPVIPINIPPAPATANPFPAIPNPPVCPVFNPE